MYHCATQIVNEIAFQLAPAAVTQPLRQTQQRRRFYPASAAKARIDNTTSWLAFCSENSAARCSSGDNPPIH
jgi:hypothetical protein